MGDNFFAVRSAILTTKEKNSNRYLSSGKIITPSGFFFYIIEALCPNNLGASIKKTLLATASAYVNYETISESVFERFLEELNETLEIVLEESDLNPMGKINSAIGFIDENKLFLSQAGRLPAYIFRKGKISSLTESIDLDSVSLMQIFKDVIYGELAKDDRIILGNNELYNHLSLDRLRKITGEQSAKIANRELFTTFKKLRSSNVNSIIVEVSKDEEPDKEKELPDILYIDEPEENLLNHWNKKYIPLVKKGLKTTGTGLLTFGKYVGKHGSKAALKTSAYIKEKAAKKKSSEDSIKDIKPRDGFKKIKVKNIYSKSTAKDSSSKILQNIWQYILYIGSFLGQKQHRKYLYLGLIVIFVAFGFMKIRSNNLNRNEIKERQEIADSYDKAKTMFDKAKEDFALGKNTSPAQFAEALEIAKKGTADPGTKDKSAELVIQIQGEIDKIGKITRIYQTSENTKTLNSTIARGIAAGNEIYLFGEDGKTYLCNSADKESTLAASFGKDKGKPKNLSYAEGNDEIFMQTTDGLVLDYDIQNKSFGTLKNVESTWPEFQSMAVFSSNIYLLDSSSGQILKFIKKDGVYTKSGIYADSKKVDIKDSLGLAVDGSVYVITKEGKLVKFTRGAPDTDFGLKNLPEPYPTIQEPKKIFSSAETNYIYILDGKANRVIRFNKAGEFVAQYSLNDGDITDFVVNDKIKSLWLISGNKITKADL